MQRKNSCDLLKTRFAEKFINTPRQKKLSIQIKRSAAVHFQTIHIWCSIWLITVAVVFDLFITSFRTSLRQVLHVCTIHPSLFCLCTWPVAEYCFPIALVQLAVGDARTVERNKLWSFPETVCVWPSSSICGPQELESSERWWDHSLLIEGRIWAHVGGGDERVDYLCGSMWFCLYRSSSTPERLKHTHNTRLRPEPGSSHSSLWEN